jgi:serine/threonine protein kinase
MAPDINELKEEVKIVAEPEAADADTGLRVGATIDEFVVEALLGRGGVSEVYRARDTRTNTDVALKFLLPSRLSDKQACERLRNEAKHMMSLRHRHIVTVMDVRESDGTGPFIVMELIEGEPLSSRIPVETWQQALAMCAQISEALAYAHSKGILHRDIKPTNVMVEAETNSVRLVDFGIAKVFAQDDAKHIPLTRTSEVVGTSLYMSPEQCFGHAVDARTDIYQLGCLLYQCATGFPPFEGSTSFEAMFKHVSAEPELRGIDEPLRSIVLKALDKNPDERFQTASEMGEALRNAQIGRTSVLRSKKKASGSLNKSAITVAAVAALLALSATFGLLHLMPNMPSAPGVVALTPAQMEAQRYYEEGLDFKAKGWTEQSRASLSKAIKLDNGAIGFKALSYLRSHLPAHFQTQAAEQMNILGYNYNFSGKQAEAEKVWQQCIAQYPNFEWPYSNLAGMYLNRGEPARAAELLAKAIEINPYYTNALRNMSEAQQALGHRDLAIEYMQRAADSDPEEPWYKQQVARLRRR